MNRHQITALTYSSDRSFTTAHHRQHSYLNGKHPIHTETSMSHRNTSLHTETALFAHKYPCSRGKRRQICRRIHTNRTEKETVLLNKWTTIVSGRCRGDCNGGGGQRATVSATRRLTRRARHTGSQPAPDAKRTSVALSVKPVIKNTLCCCT